MQTKNINCLILNDDNLAGSQARGKTENAVYTNKGEKINFCKTLFIITIKLE